MLDATLSLRALLLTLVALHATLRRTLCLLLMLGSSLPAACQLLPSSVLERTSSPRATLVPPCNPAWRPARHADWRGLIAAPATALPACPVPRPARHIEWRAELVLRLLGRLLPSVTLVANPVLAALRAASNATAQGSETRGVCACAASRSNVAASPSAPMGMCDEPAQNG